MAKQNKDTNAAHDMKQKGQCSLAKKVNSVKQNKSKESEIKMNDAERRMIEEGTVQQDNAKLLKQTIARLTKGLVDIDLLEEKEEKIRLIRGDKKDIKI